MFVIGVRFCEVKIECNDGKCVFVYDEVICGEVEFGNKIVILGVGGIGFDMVVFLSEYKG